MGKGGRDMRQTQERNQAQAPGRPSKGRPTGAFSSPSNHTRTWGQRPIGKAHLGPRVRTCVSGPFFLFGPGSIKYSANSFSSVCYQISNESRRFHSGSERI